MNELTELEVEKELFRIDFFQSELERYAEYELDGEDEG